MKLIVRGEKVEVTDSIKAYLEEKINKLDKYYESADLVEAKALIKVKGPEQKIEVTINSKNFILRAEVTHEDLYAAIDLVMDKLESQIRKNKNKIKSKMNKENVYDFIYEYEEVYEETNDNSNIIKRKKIELKPMSEEEAILQMELIGHDFFVFKNDDTDSVCVLYKRKDNNYGIIDTK